MFLFSLFQTLNEKGLRFVFIFLGAIFLFPSTSAYADANDGIFAVLKKKNISLAQTKNLLDQGADANAMDEHGNTLLWYATHDSTAVIRLLLDRGANPNLGHSPLVGAVASNNAEAANLLIASGADVNAQDDGFTALMRAAQWGNTGLALFLIRNGADIDILYERDGEYGPRDAEGIAQKGHHEETERAIPCALALRKMLSGYASMRDLSRTQRELLEKTGEFIWDDSARAFQTGEARCTAPPLSLFKGFEIVGELASAALRAEFNKVIGNRPPAPKLVQEKYESDTAFSHRVIKSKKEFEGLNISFEIKHKSTRALLENESSNWLAMAFFSVFGGPRLLGTSYDANNQRFTIITGGSGVFSGDARFSFLLADPIPNEQAHDFDSKLSHAKASIRFSLQQGKFHVIGANLKIGRKDYAALPAADMVLPQPAVVELGSLVNVAQPIPSPDVAAQYLQSPEIAAKVKELETLRTQKAKKDQLERLEAEIAQLRSETRRDPPPHHSDVDNPRFKKAVRFNDFALIIGVESYQQQLPAALFANRDAQAVKTYLLALGVPEANIIMLVGDQATRSKLGGYLEEWLPKNVNSNSRLYFYYSGHGARDTKDGSAYLVPWDGDPMLLRSTAYPIERLYATLGQMKNVETLVVLDACFSGEGGRSILAHGTRPLILAQDPEPHLGGNLSLIAAAQNNEITGSLDEQGHGVLTYFFLKGLRDGAKDTRGLYEFLKPEVSQSARRQNRDQTPVFRGINIEF